MNNNGAVRLEILEIFYGGIRNNINRIAKRSVKA